MSHFVKTAASVALVLSFATAGTGASAQARANGTEAEAVAMVTKAAALIKSAGVDTAYKTFTDNPGSTFKDRDLYIWVYDFEGNCLAHGANAKLVGKNLINLTDSDGNELIKGEINVVKTKGSGWYGPFKFTNPVNRKVETKKAYCTRGAGDTMVCSGVYTM